MSDGTERGSGDFVTDHLYLISLTAWREFYSSIQGLEDKVINSIEEAVEIAKTYGESYDEIILMSRTVALFVEDEMVDLLTKEVEGRELVIDDLEKEPTGCDYALRLWLMAKSNNQVAIEVLEKLHSIIADKVYLNAPSFCYRFPKQTIEWTWSESVSSAFKKKYEEWALGSGSRSSSIEIFIPSSNDPKQIRIIVERCARRRNAVDFGTSIRKAIPYDPLKVDSIDIDLNEGRIFIRCQESSLVKNYALWIQLTLFDNKLSVEQGKIYLQKFKNGAQWLRNECLDPTLVKASVSNISITDGSSRVQITRDTESGLRSIRDFTAKSNVIRLTLKLEFLVNKAKNEHETIILNSGDDKPSRITTGPRQSQVQAILHHAGIWSEPNEEPWNHWQQNLFTMTKERWIVHCGDEYFSESCDAGLMIRTDISHDTLEDGENYTFQPEKQNELLIAWLNLEEGPVVLSDQIYFLGIKKFKHESFAVYCPYKTVNNADENLINNHVAKYSNTKTLLITPDNYNENISSMNLQLKFPMPLPGNVRFLAINNLHMQEVADPTYWAQSTDELVYTTHGETPLFWIRDEDGLFHELGLSQQNSDVLLHLAENHGRYVAAETLGQIIGEGRTASQVVSEVRKEILAKNPSIGEKYSSFLRGNKGRYKLTLVCSGT